MTGFVHSTFAARSPDINSYFDSLYFTVSSLTTTGYGDITLPGPWGRLLSIIIMVVGISLFVRLAQVILRPNKIVHPCSDCGLRRHDPDAVHWQAVTDTARLLAACDRYDIRRVVIPSSDWAEPKTRWAMQNQNAYGYSKGVFEAMARMYNVNPNRHCVALRIGWVARNLAEVEAADIWLQANYWDDARLIGQVQAALGD